MRDATKIVALRQEHSAQTSTKSRTKLAFDFRQQVEEHKIELERLERKLLTTSRFDSISDLFRPRINISIDFHLQPNRLCNKAAWSR